MKFLPILLFFSFISNAQQFEKQVDSLSWMSSGEEWGERLPTAKRVLKVDPNNFEAHEYIVEHFVDRLQFNKAYAYIDSILALEDPDPMAILSLSYGLNHMAPYSHDSLYDSYYFKVLRKCLEYESTIGTASYHISKAYYTDFILPTRKSLPTTWQYEPDSLQVYHWDLERAETTGMSLDSIRENRRKSKIFTSTYSYSADSALKYLEILASSDDEYNEISKVPIAQLKTHLGLESDYDLDSNLYNGHYFPEWYFGYLSENWKEDLTNDLMNEMLFTSFRKVDFLSNQLQDVEEPILFGQNNNKTYRLTWLPSFHHPIIIRIELQESNAFISWKIGKGMGGYEPIGLKKKGRKKISLDEFNRISSLLDSIELNSQYSYYYYPMFDGASLTTEMYDGKEMKAFRTNVPSDEAIDLLVHLSAKYFRKEKKKIEEYR